MGREGAGGDAGGNSPLGDLTNARVAVPWAPVTPRVRADAAGGGEHAGAGGGAGGIRRQSSFMSAEDWVNSLPEPVFTSDSDDLNVLVKSLGEDLERAVGGGDGGKQAGGRGGRADRGGAAGRAVACGALPPKGNKDAAGA